MARSTRRSASVGPLSCAGGVACWRCGRPIPPGGLPIPVVAATHRRDPKSGERIVESGVTGSSAKTFWRPPYAREWSFVVLRRRDELARRAYAGGRTASQLCHPLCHGPLRTTNPALRAGSRSTATGFERATAPLHRAVSAPLAGSGPRRPVLTHDDRVSLARLFPTPEVGVEPAGRLFDRPGVSAPRGRLVCHSTIGGHHGPPPMSPCPRRRVPDSSWIGHALSGVAPNAILGDHRGMAGR